MIFKKFCSNIEKGNMLKAGDGVVAAVSGGADSICLLSLLIKLRERKKINIYCAHLNHGIRETAKRDENFVRSFCENNGVDFFSKELNIPQIARERHISEELCGREERYSFFFEVLKHTGSAAIFTAHNKNDNAETMLLHLIRGSGMGGMRGIGLSRGDRVFRPMINIGRGEIEEYLNKYSIKWVSDETNDTDLYTRNFIRHNIIPQMEKINPAVVDSFLKSAEIFAEDDDFLCKLAEKSGATKIFGNDVLISADILKKQPVPIGKRIIISAIKRAAGTVCGRDIEALYELAFSGTGKKYIFPSGLTAVKQYDRILIHRPTVIPHYEYQLEAGREIYIRETNMYVKLSEEKPSGKSVGLRGDVHYKVRKKKDGDRFMPFGMQSEKKLKDFFIDLKIPASERDRVPILVNGEKIACVGNLRPDASFAAKDKPGMLYFCCRSGGGLI